MWRSTRKIVPIVSNQTTQENRWIDFSAISLWRMPYSWWSFAKNANSQKDVDGDFMAAKELEKFLLPYRHCINTPNNSRIFDSFLVQIYNKNSTKKNEIHLSKVIVLLKLLADPNLPEDTLSPWPPTLGNLFDHCEIGFDVANLLFSYGYNYTHFLVGLQIYVYEQIEEKIIINFRDMYAASANDHAYIQDILNSPAENKDNFAHKFAIDRRMLDVVADNPHIQTYQALRDAYKAYESNDYKTASNEYQKAYRLLRTLKHQEGLSVVIQKDYQRRYEESKHYHQLCNELLTEEQQRSPQRSPLSNLNCWSSLNKVWASRDNLPSEYGYKKLN